MSLEFRVLGSLQVLALEGPIRLSAHKPRVVLLRLLASAGNPVSTDALADAVWGASPPLSTAKLVQVYISQLRKALGADVIQTVPAGYRLVAEPGQVDAHRFARLVTDARQVVQSHNAALAASLLAQAESLWRGSAYAEVADEPFAQAEIRRLTELRAQCREERLSVALDNGAADDVIAQVAGLISEDPMRESLRALQVRALAHAGRRADALAAYQQARQMLRDELGLDPGPRLREAHALALGDEAHPAGSPTAEGPRAPVVTRLPEPPTELIGRARELTELQELLARRDVRLVTLTGAGGSGKTRLAVALAGAVGGNYANGVYLAELASLRDPSHVILAIAEAFGISPRSERVIADVIEWLADRELLLVVDNVEHLPRAFPDLATLVAAAPRLTMVVTGRRVMHVSGEHVYPVQPLALDAAAQLFVQRARAADPEFSGSPGDSEVTTICERLEGLPLSIELAAARVAILPMQALLERLGRRLSVLTVGPRDLPARQQTLRGTLEWSANLLTAQQRTILARMAVFPAGCTLDCVERFVGANLDALGVLVNFNLVRRVDADDGPRFVMLETIREYADGLLDHDRAAAVRALVDHVADLAARAEVRGPHQAKWLPLLNAEHDNVRAALALGTDDDTRLQIVARLWRYWWVRGYLSEGRAQLLDALAGETTDGEARAQALYGAAGLSWAAGALGDARRYAEEASAHAQAIGSVWGQMAANTCLGEVCKDEGDLAGARHHHEAALAIARENAWTIDIATSELNLANVILEAGDAVTARPLLTSVLAFHRSQGTSEGVGFASLNLGELAYDVGDQAAQRLHFTEALRAFGEVGFDSHSAYAMQGLAVVADPAEAARLLGRAAAILERTRDASSSFTRMAAAAEAVARAQLGDADFAASFASGQAT